MDQALWLRSVWRHRALSALIFILALLATVAYLLVTPKTYQSTSLIAGSSFSEGVTVDVDRVLPTLAQLSTSDEVGTAARREVPGPVPGQVSANPLQNTLLLQVAVTGQDPVRVARYSNAVSRVLISRNPLPKFVHLSIVQAAVAQPGSASPSAKVVLPLGVLVSLALAVIGAVGLDRVSQYRSGSGMAAGPERVRRGSLRARTASSTRRPATEAAGGTAGQAGQPGAPPSPNPSLSHSEDLERSTSGALGEGQHSPIEQPEAPGPVPAEVPRSRAD